MSEFELWLEIVVFLLFIVLFCLGMIMIVKRSVEWIDEESIDDEVDDE